jgi:hypothetical protein
VEHNRPDVALRTDSRHLTGSVVRDPEELSPLRRLLPTAGARLRSTGGRLVRRAGLLPGGEPDGLGDDARLGELVLDQRVAVFFPEPPRNAYQVEQWLQPLAALDTRHGVMLLTQDSRTTARLRAVTTLPVLAVGRTATLEGLVRRGRLALALYVSHHPRNFQCLRFGELAHVYLGHGESDKAVSASNQLKAYDRVFVAGQAAVDRALGELMWLDEDRFVQVGRPQLGPEPPRPRPLGARSTVLYAPTWDGAQASMAYCSVATHGEALVRSLVAAGLRVVYRPHPRTGANRPEVRDADASLRAVFREPEMRAAGSAVVSAAPLAEAFAEADALVTDISSLAVEWLPTGRPLVVTEPAEGDAVIAPSPLLEVVPRLAADTAAGAGPLVAGRLRDDVEAGARARLLRHYLAATGDAALQRFLDACDIVLAQRDAARAAVGVNR